MKLKETIIREESTNSEFDDAFAAELCHHQISQLYNIITIDDDRYKMQFIFASEIDILDTIRGKTELVQLLSQTHM